MDRDTNEMMEKNLKTPTENTKTQLGITIFESDTQHIEGIGSTKLLPPDEITTLRLAKSL